ncbi:MAG: 3-keto-disaccharide hydrolase [Opitutales bacterium]
MKFSCLLSIPLLALTCLGLEPPAFMGDWEGRFIDAPEGSWQANNPSIVAKIVGMPDGAFEVQFMNAFERRAEVDFRKTISPSDGTLKFKSKAWTFEIEGDTLRGIRKQWVRKKMHDIPFEMKKVERLSPTLGRPAPEGAEDLFADGSLGKWHHKHGREASWKVLENGVVECWPKKSGNKQGGDLFTKKHYRDCEIHLEFRLPYLPDRLGQDRANSGLYIMNYEIQILDSYGFEANWTSCGALYKVSPSKVNRSAPPGQWQTYDIVFRAPRFDEAGKVTEHATITVKHNGRLIHNEQEIFEITQYFEINRPKDPPFDGPLELQDHGHAIQFRNFWIREL